MMARSLLKGGPRGSSSAGEGAKETLVSLIRCKKEKEGHSLPFRCSTVLARCGGGGDEDARLLRLVWGRKRKGIHCPSIIAFYIVLGVLTLERVLAKVLKDELS